MGRIHPKKGLDLLVRALPIIATKHPAIRIVVAGPDEGAHRAEIERLAQTLGVLQRLDFTGLVKAERKQQLLRGARFFVLPSHSEGFSMALLEALAAGVPVVATKACEVGTLETNEAAILVDAAPEAIASGIDAVLSRSEYARRLAMNGKCLVAREYTWNRVGGQILDMYEAAIRAGD